MEIQLSDGSSIYEPLPRLPKDAAPLDDGLIDLHTVANSLFIAEREMVRGFGRVAKIGLPLRNGLSKDLSDTLDSLFVHLYGYSPSFDTRPTPQSLEPEFKAEWSNGYTALFSCGMDSTSGILAARRRFPVRGMMTLHPDFPNLTSTMHRLKHNVLEPLDIGLGVATAPPHGAMNRLTRGILYVTNAVLLHARNIIIPEVGPTMYQPRFTLLDEIARTTDPALLTKAKELVRLITGEPITLIKPSENLTKAEAGRASPQPDILSETTSCVSTMFISSGEPHCGSCYGCVVRRLAFSVLGQKDRPYWKTGFTGEGADNTAHLVRFSLDFLVNPESVPWYTMENIRGYHKEELFRRFALDNLAGLVLLPDSHNLLQKRLVELVLSKVGKSQLEDRVARIRGGRYSLDFQSVSSAPLVSSEGNLRY